MNDFKIPKEVQNIANILIKHRYKAYLVGGCVRDLLSKDIFGPPKDWDIATDALPDDVHGIFEDSVYENSFGTVGIKTRSEEESLKIVEVTTFRVEGKYSDNRRPDDVEFVKTIEEDLSRRDFTMNAMAIDLDLKNKEEDIIDPFSGMDDLKNKLIRAVGNAEDRFEEDALRLMRAVRFTAQLEGFEIEKKTGEAIFVKSKLLKNISEERKRDEFIKIVNSSGAADGIFSLEKYGLLEYIVPELREGIGCKQNKHHVYEVFEHNVRALEYSAKKGYSLGIRLASLMHDIGKAKSKRGGGEDATFHGHEVVGARMAKKILERLRFSSEITEKVVHLIRYHMFYYNVGEVSEAGVRRFLARVGPENIDDILKVREADRIGSKVPKAFPYKLRHLLFMIEKVKHDPVHPKMLKVRGDGIMKLLAIPEGPKVGQILFILLEEVIDDPLLNTEEYLARRAKELGTLPEKELKKLADTAKKKRDEFELGVEKDMKGKYYVK